MRLPSSDFVCPGWADQYKNMPIQIYWKMLPPKMKWICQCGKYSITKTRLYNFDPLKPHYYIVKLGFTGVYIIFLISAQTHRLWYSLEPPRRGGSNEYPQSMFLSRNMKNIRFFLSENFQFLEVTLSIYLNRRVFVMVLGNCKPRY